ncbi:MAG: hypothetical protein IJS94_06545 [Clostridia bacterium]|nr:hypothetical protein [Clostridia bacterium]
MKQVILSADGDDRKYVVPDIVADNLEEYCLKFIKWLINSSKASSYRKKFKRSVHLCYDESDFIDWLNKYVFPKDPDNYSKYVKNIGFNGGKDYPDLPWFNF